MPSIDMALCAHLLRGADGLKPVLDIGFKPEHFFDEGKKVFKYVFDHFAQYGKVPDVATTEQDTKIQIPPMSDIPEPISYYIDRIRARALDYLAKEQVKKMVTGMDKLDTPGVVDAAKELLTEISKQNLQGEPIYDWTINTGDRWNEYQKVKALPGGLTGIPTPWPLLNEITQGINKGEFWVIAGRPGTGKSWQVFLMALYCWMMEKKPLLISMEMPPKKVARRIDAMYAKVPYKDLKRGKLTSEIVIPDSQEKQYKDALDGLAGRAPLQIITRKRVKVVHDVAILIEQLKPDVVFIDGLYKLKPTTVTKNATNWEKIMALADEVQELALDKDIPIVSTTQFARTQVKKGQDSMKGGLEHLAFADAIGMNADVILAYFTSDQFKANKEILARLLKNREDETGAWRRKFDLDTMDFSEIAVYEDSEDDDGGGGGNASVDFTP